MTSSWWLLGIAAAIMAIIIIFGTAIGGSDSTMDGTNRFNAESVCEDVAAERYGVQTNGETVRINANMYTVELWTQGGVRFGSCTATETSEGNWSVTTRAR